MIDLIKERLAAIAPPPFKAIEGAVSLAEIRDNPPPREKCPRAFVIPMSHAPKPARHGTGVTMQEFAARYGVVIAQAAQAQRLGEKAIDELEPLYKAVRAQLFGWQPADDVPAGEIFMTPMVFVSGQLSGIGRGLALWLDTFSIDQLLRSM